MDLSDKLLITAFACQVISLYSSYKTYNFKQRIVNEQEETINIYRHSNYRIQRNLTDIQIELEITKQELEDLRRKFSPCPVISDR